MFIRLHVIIASEDAHDEHLIKNLLLQINPQFSISPSREYAGLQNHSEFYITCEMNQEDIQPLLDRLNNDWDGEEGDYFCYGFNTHMFHQLIYYLGLTIFD